MTAAVDDAVITHGLEYTSANLYVNNNVFASITIFICAFSYGFLMPSYRGATRRIRAMRGATVVSPNRQKKTAH
jgi:hypothetical protein